MDKSPSNWRCRTHNSPGPRRLGHPDRSFVLHQTPLRSLLCPTLPFQIIASAEGPPFRKHPNPSTIIQVFNENDIINVEKYTANIKLLIDNTSSRPFNMATILPSTGDEAFAQKLKQMSYQKYGSWLRNR